MFANLVGKRGSIYIEDNAGGNVYQIFAKYSTKTLNMFKTSAQFLTQMFGKCFHKWTQILEDIYGKYDTRQH